MFDKEKSMNKQSARPLAVALLVLGALIRVTQHWNFAPVGALSLFAGARLRGWMAWALPLGLMAVTDPLVGGYSRSTPLISSNQIGPFVTFWNAWSCLVVWVRTSL